MKKKLNLKYTKNILFKKKTIQNKCFAVLRTASSVQISAVTEYRQAMDTVTHLKTYNNPSEKNQIH